MNIIDFAFNVVNQIEFGISAEDLEAYAEVRNYKILDTHQLIDNINNGASLSEILKHIKEEINA